MVVYPVNSLTMISTLHYKAREALRGTIKGSPIRTLPADKKELRKAQKGLDGVLYATKFTCGKTIIHTKKKLITIF